MMAAADATGVEKKAPPEGRWMWLEHPRDAQRRTPGNKLNCYYLFIINNIIINYLSIVYLFIN